MTNQPWQNEPDLAELARLYAVLKSCPEDALPGLRSLAHRGSALSACYIAETYKAGVVVAKDMDAAEHWYKFAEHLGHTPATHNLWWIYEEQGNLQLAVQKLKEGVVKEYPPSMYQLARHMYFGIGMPKSSGNHEYIELLRRGGKKGHILCRAWLARMYLVGRFGWVRAAWGIIMIFSMLIDVVRLWRKPPDKFTDHYVG